MDLACPFAQDLKLLKPSLTREFIQCVFFKVSSTLTVIVFIVSTVLHFTFMYVYHGFNLRDEIFPKPSTRNSAIRLVPQIRRDCPEDISKKLSKSYHLIRHISNESSETPPMVPQKTHFQNQLKQHHLHLLLHKVFMIMFMFKTQSQQEGTMPLWEKQKKPAFDAIA